MVDLRLKLSVPSNRALPIAYEATLTEIQHPARLKCVPNVSHCPIPTMAPIIAPIAPTTIHLGKDESIAATPPPTVQPTRLAIHHAWPPLIREGKESI